MTNAQTEIEMKRAAWRAEHPFQPGMSLDEVFHLNEECITRFPMTSEEREPRAKDMVDALEFIL